MMKNRILILGLMPPLEGGSQRHVYEIAKRLYPEFEGDILTQRADLKLPEFWMNICFAIAVYFWSFRLIFGKKRYDVLHIHENLLYFLAPLLCWRYRIVVTVHGLQGFKFYDNKFLWFWFSWALGAADRVIAVSPTDFKLLSVYNPVYIPNGTDLSLYTKPRPIKNKIVFVGRIHFQKGIGILLKALPQEANLEVIGDKNNDYAKELMSLHSSKNIKWLGGIKDRHELIKHLESAHIIVLPSRFEGMPLVLFEAMASGRPVIVSDIEAFKSVVTDKEVQFFKSEDAEDLKQKIYKLLKNKNMADSLGKRGKKFAREYDWNVIANKTKEIYNEC